MVESSVLKFALMSELSAIQEAIETSKSLLDLRSNWDDDGALAIEQGIYEQAIAFLKDYSMFVFKIYNVVLAAPDINPVKNGTIDLEWHTSSARMLVNIRGDIAAYYGDNLDDLNSIKGRVSTHGVEGFLANWMTKLNGQK